MSDLSLDSHGRSQDYDKALELWHRAGELGCAQAYNFIGDEYNTGKQGVKRDLKRAEHYYVLGAMGGNVYARYNLGLIEKHAGRDMTRALKHFMIAVAGGHGRSLKQIQMLYSNGHATKDEYTKALRAYQAYLVDIKSPQRDAASAARADCRYY